MSILLWVEIEVAHKGSKLPEFKLPPHEEAPPKRRMKFDDVAPAVERLEDSNYQYVLSYSSEGPCVSYAEYLETVGTANRQHLPDSLGWVTELVALPLGATSYQGGMQELIEECVDRELVEAFLRHGKTIYEEHLRQRNRSPYLIAPVETPVEAISFLYVVRTVCSRDWESGHEELEGLEPVGPADYQVNQDAITT